MSRQAVHRWSRWYTRNIVYIFVTTLTNGPQEVIVAWTGARNPSSTGTTISLDGIAWIG